MLSAIELRNDGHLSDEIYQEICILEAIIYGLCKIIRDYDEPSYSDMSIAATAQIVRIKQIADQIIQN